MGGPNKAYVRVRLVKPQKDKFRVEFREQPLNRHSNLNRPKIKLRKVHSE